MKLVKRCHCIKKRGIFFIQKGNISWNSLGENGQNGLVSQTSTSVYSWGLEGKKHLTTLV